MRRSALNALIMQAHRAGLHVFRCFGCGDWFTQKRTKGRPRVVCDDPWCQRERRHWMAYGRRPVRETPPPAGWRARHKPALLAEVA